MSAPSQTTQEPRIPRYIRQGEREHLQVQLQEIETTKRETDRVGRMRGENAQQIREAEQRVRGMIEAQTPPQTTPTERDRLKKRIEEDEKVLREGIPSQETMRRNTGGAVNQNLQWMRRRGADGLTNNQRVKRWRADQRTLLQNDVDGDYLDRLCEVDRLRPRSAPENFDDAQIPRTSFMADMRTVDWDNPKAMDWDSFRDNSPARHDEQIEEKDKKLAEALAEIKRLKNRNQGNQNHRK